jgi:hypothetical protein
MYPLLQAVVYFKEPAGVGERENGNLMLPPQSHAVRRRSCPNIKGIIEKSSPSDLRILSGVFTEIRLPQRLAIFHRHV